MEKIVLQSGWNGLSCRDALSLRGNDTKMKLDIVANMAEKKNILPTANPHKWL